MYTIIILCLLCAVEFGLFYLKWSEIEEYVEIGDKITKVTGLANTKSYGKFVMVIGGFLKVGKYIMMIVVPVIFVVNLIVSAILGSIISLVVSLF